MKGRTLLVFIISGLMVPAVLYSQSRSPFSGDPSKFRAELTTYMGPNLNDNQKLNLDRFFVRWDSAAFGNENMTRILDLVSQFYGRAMRPVPNFNNLLASLNTFINNNYADKFIADWLTGLSEIVFNLRFTNDNIDRYVRNTTLMINDNVLAESAAVKWKVKNCKMTFLHDTVFIAIIKDATLTCYSQRDSTEIYDVSGTYFPEIQQFHGIKGRITWEKAGFPASDVYAQIDNYIINTARNSFTVDSALLTHKTYFKSPVPGVLTDQAVSFRNKERATFPVFETYAKEFRLENIHEGVNYKGGLAIAGSNIKGTGTKAVPARITLLRNDTLYLKLTASEFEFHKTGLASAETTMTLYLGHDSIYHSNLGFSYNAAKRLVNLYSGNNNVSKSPYFDSFHNIDMYFELLSWDMKESRIMLTRARGAALGHAQFESVSFFNSDYFLRLSGIDNENPLVQMKEFAEWYYSETFPVEEFAQWVGKPVEAVKGLCIALANNGFVFYDRVFNEVTLKKKVTDFLKSYAREKDYDVMQITSETRAPLDNAVLDLRNYKMTINGVTGVYLSDSQNVAIYPAKQQLVLGRNRKLEFDGVVDAGLFTVYGHNFAFDYDSFKIRLQKVDSIKIAVETDKKDEFGNPVIKQINNIIELGTADLYIDDPDNKSGLLGLKQYPIINAVTYSYIYYDRIPGLEGVYPRGDFYFKVDPFTYENIDHYTSESMNLAGEFHAGNIFKPIRQFLVIQENNSLGFNLKTGDEGIEVYGARGRFFNDISMSNNGLLGSGRLTRITSTTTSGEFRFFPDSMLTSAETFNIAKDGSGLFPVLKSDNVKVKWLTRKDEWLASNEKDKPFEIFDNGTVLDGSLKLTPLALKGTGVLNTTDSRITSDHFSFTTNSIKADTSVYNLKSRTTSGYSFIAENARTNVNFDLRTTTFHLNTDTSVVKFPEIQYICTMTDFTYNMDSRILKMEQKGKSDKPLLTPDKLVKLDFNKLDKPTFFATNVIGDTIAFSSWKGSYHLNEEYIEAENINYIHVADALIQPGKGKIIIDRRAKIREVQDAIIAINNRHVMHSAKVDIESTKKYSGSGIYDYVDENKNIQQISFPEITVDTMKTSAKGFIPSSQKFMLSPAFTFTGDVNLYSGKEFLLYSGGAGIIHDCDAIKSYSLRFKSYIDPVNIMIPIGGKPRDLNDNMIFSGSFINIDSMHVYPTFLSPQKSWTDANIVSAEGFLYYEKAKSRYLITSREKLADPSIHGNRVSFDRIFNTLSGEGKINFGADYDLVKLSAAGKIIHSLDSGDVNIQAILAFDFHFSPGALLIMSDELGMIPTLKPVNLNTEFYNKAMKDILGAATANQIKEEIDLFGIPRNLPREFNFELFLNDVTLYWNNASSSFRSKGKIGIGFIGTQTLNVYVDGYVEIQRRRSGDMFDIYLKADESTFYYFSYMRGNMMVQAGNNTFNALIANTKQGERKHPDSSVRHPYSYMIAVEDRLGKFLQRMTATGN